MESSKGQQLSQHKGDAKLRWITEPHSLNDDRIFPLGIIREGRAFADFAGSAKPAVFQRSDNDGRSHRLRSPEEDVAGGLGASGVFRSEDEKAVVALNALAIQADAILPEFKGMTGNGRYVFPSLRRVTKPISENTLHGALRRMGYSNGEVTAHGFRATAAVRLNEMGCCNPDVIRRQLV